MTRSGLYCCSTCFAKGIQIVRSAVFYARFPFVPQIENQTGGKDVFQERVSKNLVPCLAQLAVTAGKDVHWKPLNYQVLLKTRHSSPQVVCATFVLITLVLKYRAISHIL